MKTRLLRKIRKRFGWYINRDGLTVVVDKKNQRVETFTPYGDKSNFKNTMNLSFSSAKQFMLSYFDVKGMGNFNRQVIRSKNKRKFL